MSVIKPSIFLFYFFLCVKVFTSLMVIFVTTKRIHLLAIQELIIFVWNVYDLLSVEEFNRPFSRDRSSLNQLRLNMFTYFIAKMTYIHYRRQLNQKLKLNTIKNDLWNLFWQSLVVDATRLTGSVKPGEIWQLNIWIWILQLHQN